MVLIDIIKPLSTFLKPAPLINLSNIKIIFRECRDLNPGHWVRSKNLTSVLPMQGYNEATFLLKWEDETMARAEEKKQLKLKNMSVAVNDRFQGSQRREKASKRNWRENNFVQFRFNLGGFSRRRPVRSIFGSTSFGRLTVGQYRHFADWQLTNGYLANWPFTKSVIGPKDIWQNSGQRILDRHCHLAECFMSNTVLWRTDNWPT